jgi:hypothetical protein
VGLGAAVFKSISTMEREFSGYRFQREPITGECEVIHPEDVELGLDEVVAYSLRFGDISHIGDMRAEIEEYLGEMSALERLVLYSGSHSGDIIEEPSFGELERELKLIESSSDPYVQKFADGLSELIAMARREKNPIVFV